jgi:outer membrane protein TolC
LVAYENAVRQSTKNYRLQREDEEIGRSTNLEVLTAQKQWLDAMRLRDQSKISERLNWIKLQVSSGVLP